MKSWTGTTGNKGERMNNKNLFVSNMAENEQQAEVVDLPALVRPWDWIEANPCKALRMAGVSFREQAKAEYLRVHVVAEDPRYPTMCVNGELNFGISINAETGMPVGARGCICEARAGDTCICDLGTNTQF
jgi:hypothetical protein